MIIINTEEIQGNLTKEYYRFYDYVSKERMITYWYQLYEILKCEPNNILEIGIGTKIVTGILREMGYKVATADINKNLKPDYIVPIQKLDKYFAENTFDLVVCARVLHHIQFEEFEKCLLQLKKITRKYVILTLPVDDLRFYFSFRVTSTNNKIISINFPISLKRIFIKALNKEGDYYRKLWKINHSSKTLISEIKKIINQHFNIIESYSIPEDKSHHFFVLHV